MGYIENVVTAQTIFNMLLKHDELIQFTYLFESINWKSTKNVANAFKKIFTLIEENVVEHK